MNKGSGFRQGLSVAFRLGTELTVAIMIGTVMGYALDRYLETKPWCLVVGLIMGGVAGCLNVYRTAKGITIDNDDRDHDGC